MTLDPEHLKQEAMAQTGLSNFGEAPMDEGLNRLCWSLTNEAAVNGNHLTTAKKMIHNALMERLKIEDCLASNPEILNEKVVRPLFVISLPRTGSTATSQFLSEDPNARSIRRWECENTTPPPDVEIGDADPRITAMRAEFEEMYRQQPERRGMLPIDAEDPSEHGPILGLTFQNLQLPSLFAIPSYMTWTIESDLVPSYAYLKKVLQLLQWKTPASHWNLKNPPDVFGLKALIEIFPDARLLWIHRDPVKSIPSVCSLTSMIRISFGENLDKPAVGAMQTEFQATGARLAMEAEATMVKDRIVHVFQRDLVRDTVGVIENAYRQLDLEFSEDYREHLTRRVANREKPSHTYKMEDYGLSVEGIRTAFQSYTDRYQVPLEG